MLIQEIIDVLETVAPPQLQESYDNAGLIVGDPATVVTGVLFCLDSTEAVVEEAIGKGCNLVVAHHPILFRGLKRLNGATYVVGSVLAIFLSMNVGFTAALFVGAAIYLLAGVALPRVDEPAN